MCTTTTNDDGGVNPKPPPPSPGSTAVNSDSSSGRYWETLRSWRQKTTMIAKQIIITTQSWLQKQEMFVRVMSEVNKSTQVLIDMDTKTRLQMSNVMQKREMERRKMEFGVELYDLMEDEMERNSGRKAGASSEDDDNDDETARVVDGTTITRFLNHESFRKAVKRVRLDVLDIQETINVNNDKITAIDNGCSSNVAVAIEGEDSDAATVVGKDEKIPNGKDQKLDEVVVAKNEPRSEDGESKDLVLEKEDDEEEEESGGKNDIESSPEKEKDNEDDGEGKSTREQGEDTSDSLDEKIEGCAQEETDTEKGERKSDNKGDDGC